MNLVKRINDYLKSINTFEHLDIVYALDLDNIQWSDVGGQIRNTLEEDGSFNIEIIYYATAMEILSKYDNSLRESLMLASELGFNIENLSSEVLASLLVSDMEREEFSNIEEEITDIFAGMYEELEEEFEESLSAANFMYSEGEINTWIFEVKLKCNQA